MLVRKLSLVIAAAGMAVASVASAQAIPSRLAATVTNANYQDDDEDGASTAVILGVVLIVLIGIAAISGGGDDEPTSP